MDNVMSLFVSLLALIGILLVMQIITVEIMARKALKTNNTGYFMIFNLPYSYNRSARMGFVYFFVYLLFFFLFSYLFYVGFTVIETVDVCPARVVPVN